MCSWMFNNRKLNNHINHILYQGYNLTFNELLTKGGFFKSQDRNLQKSLIEIFKVKMKLAHETMNEVLDMQNAHILLELN